MKKICPLAPLLFFLVSCVGGPSDSEPDVVPAAEPLFFSAPTDSGLVFFGVTGIRSNPKETIKFALEDAARRVAVFHQVSGEYLSVNSIGSGAFDYSSNVQTALYYDSEGAARYVDDLNFNADVDAFEMENTFIIRTRYNAALPEPLDFRAVRISAPGSKPGWVDNPPARIGNYEVGVGFAGRHSTFAATVLVSYNNAIFAIIRNLNVTSRNSEMIYHGSGLLDFKTSSDQTVYASGSLKNFYVLDTWVDPRSKSVWTLAIANKSE